VSGRLVLVRHGQSFGNVHKRLDTRPPGAELTPLGREQARDFAKALPSPPGLLLHSVATRAVQTAEEISGVVGVSQVHVSRLLRGAIEKMRARLDPEENVPAASV